MKLKMISAIFLVALTPALTAQTQQKPRVALVLSGGGARGGAHVGVLRALEEARIPVDLIVGTSFGALVGGLYSVGYSPDDIELVIREMDWDRYLEDTPDRMLLDVDKRSRSDQKMLTLSLKNFNLQLPTGLQGGYRIRLLLDRLTALPVLRAGNDFDGLSVRFRAVTTDLLTGRTRSLDSGPLGEALRASMAVPGFFTPVERGDELLVDGGVSDNLPVDVALEAGAEVVIAVDISTPLRTRKEEIGSLFDVLDQVIGLHIEETKQVSRQRAHILIVPELGDFSASDFANAADLGQKGYQKTVETLPAIRELLEQRRIGLASGGARPNLFDPGDFDVETVEYPGELEGIDVVQVLGISPGLLKRDAIRLEGLDTVGEVAGRASSLYATDRFEDVSFRLEEQGTGTQLTFELQESTPTQIGLGVRFDPDFGVLGAFNATRRNLLGPQSDLRLIGLFGSVQKGLFELSVPVFRSSFSVNPGIHWLSHKRDLFEGEKAVARFDDQRVGLQLGLRWGLAERLALEGGYLIENLEVKPSGPSPVEGQSGILAGWQARLRFDTLDDFNFPSRGSLATVWADWRDEAWGSERAFSRFGIDGDHFFTLGDRASLGLGGEWGLVKGDDAPFNELIFAGGAHYLSFASRQFVGLSRDEIVARQMLAARLGYRQLVFSAPLSVLRKVYLGGRYQAGLFSQQDELLEFRDLLHGYSGYILLDARYIGPIRLELAGTDSGRFNVYFSLGYFF